jgi:hypothetical protein
MLPEVQRKGLRTVVIGKSKYTTGQWLDEFIRGLAGEQQRDGNGKPSENDNQPIEMPGGFTPDPTGQVRRFQ